MPSRTKIEKMKTITVYTESQNKAQGKSDNYFKELRAKMPEKLNKLGEWFFSSESDYQLQINDMKAVLK